MYRTGRDVSDTPTQDVAICLVSKAVPFGNDLYFRKYIKTHAHTHIHLYIYIIHLYIIHHTSVCAIVGITILNVGGARILHKYVNMFALVGMCICMYVCMHCAYSTRRVNQPSDKFL